MNVDGVSANVHNLLPQIRQRCRGNQKTRRLPRDLADKLRQTEMFSLGVPRAIGGKEATPLELMRTIETVSVADRSTGWCAMVGIANNISAGYMTDRAPGRGPGIPRRRPRESQRQPGRPFVDGDAGERPMAVCERCDAPRLALGRLPRHGGQSSSYDADGARIHPRVHARWRRHDSRHVARQRPARNRQRGCQRRGHPRARSADVFPARPERAPGPTTLPDATSPSLFFQLATVALSIARGTRQSGRARPDQGADGIVRCWRTRLPCMWTSLVLEPCWAAAGVSLRDRRGHVGDRPRGRVLPTRVSWRWVAPHRRMPWTRPQP